MTTIGEYNHKIKDIGEYNHLSSISLNISTWSNKKKYPQAENAALEMKMTCMRFHI